MTSASDRIAMAKAIVDFEARRDKSGHLVVYRLPANDGGGAYEVAGINQKYDRKACDALVRLIGADKFDEADSYAAEYIAKNTDPAASMTSVPMIESYLRDCVFNRGERGATRILQRALNVNDDGEIGPVTRAAMKVAEKDPDELLQSLRDAREDYERHVVGYRANFWNGLVNRWNKSVDVARRFPKTAETHQVATQEAEQPDLAGRIVKAMEAHGYKLFTGPGQVNVVYVEGMDPDGKVNDDAPDRFNDTRMCIRFDAGKPVIVGAWEGTTEPGRYWTEHRMNPAGAARIEFGQYSAWQLGDHHGHEALVQTGGFVTVRRDDNEDFSREGDKPDTGFFGINQHGGYDLPKDALGRSSAGCLVGRSMAGHRKFMALVKSDPRFVADKRYVFSATVIPAAWV